MSMIGMASDMLGFTTASMEEGRQEEERSAFGRSPRLLYPGARVKGVNSQPCYEKKIRHMALCAGL